MTGDCPMPDCGRPLYCRGYCRRHYYRMVRTGNPLGRAGVLPIDRFTRFWQLDEATGCWLWTSCIDPCGYGTFTERGKNIGAHRWSYQHHVGPIPAGLELDHLCFVRHCVNPAHLEPVTHHENTLRGKGLGAINIAKTHCPHGHPYNEANTRWYRGHRYCRQCKREAGRADRYPVADLVLLRRAEA